MKSVIYICIYLERGNGNNIIYLGILYTYIMQNFLEYIKL